MEQTEELYRRAISCVGAVPYSYDFRTRSYLFIGEGIEQLIGYKPNEITPKLWNQITKETVMGGETAGLTKEEAAQGVIKGQIRNWRCDMRVSTRDGESRWISDASVHSFDESGQFIGSIGILQDVTERKRAEVTSTAFSKLGQRLMTATTPQEAAQEIAQIADELFGWDACGFYLYFNETDSIYPVLFIDSFEDGRRDVLPPEDFTNTEPSVIERRLLAKGAELTLKEGSLAMQPESIPYGNKSRPSASIMRVSVRAGSRVVGFLHIHSYTLQAYTRKDLTLLQTMADYCGGALERIWAENALRKSESQFRVVWENSVDGMRLTDNEGIVWTESMKLIAAWCKNPKRNWKGSQSRSFIIPTWRRRY